VTLAPPSSSFPAPALEPWHRRFQGLMPFRVREILLVSSAYDAFVLEEDGSLSDRLFYEYSELSLSWAPRITHAPTLAQALEQMSMRRFDLCITVVKLGDGDAAELGREIRARAPDMPVVLLIFDAADLRHFPDGRAPAGIDRVFQWTGSEGVFIAAIKHIEDRQNVLHDTRVAGVQVIVVVEDQVPAYSAFLGLLYPALLAQSGSLIGEGLNDLHRLMRMRARPKIVLATSYEDALDVLDRHRSFVCALMTDLRIPKGGVENPLGGVELGKLVRARSPEVPILLQSAESEAIDHAYDLGAWFIDKNAPDFKSHVRLFLEEALGFGDFVFRLPDRTEVARARDVYELERQLETVPADAVAFHASCNHFSMWLRARSLFPLAEKIRAQSIDGHPDIESLRRALIDSLRRAREAEQAGVITDLSARFTGPENRFVRVGRGSIGGKGRGIAFVSTQIVRHGLLARFEGLQIRIPKTVVLSTDAFDALMQQLDVAALSRLESDRAVSEKVQRASFPEAVERDLARAFAALRGPIAVRSSSLLEDSRFQPFAGVYATYMLPNNHRDPEVRFRRLVAAIKAVYASGYWREARGYLAGTPHEAADQKMAVVIQQIVGRRFGTRYYPPAAGVAQSYNYYPVGAQRASDGVALLALGLGHTVVEGGAALRFSPGAPAAMPQLADAGAFVRDSQHEFLALDLSRQDFDPLDPPHASLVPCSLADAEEDGSLTLAGSVYSPSDDVIRENLSLSGPRVVTFNNLLKWKSLPLADALLELLALLRDGVGEEVEIEFALDVPSSHGAPLSATAELAAARGARLYVLQLRPMTSPDERHIGRELRELAEDALVVRSDVALGHGLYEDLRDVVWVERPSLDARSGAAIVRAVGELNARLLAAQRPYLLIGPGRWGSADPTLGIGVVWGDISGARVIVETPVGGRRIEPSQGTHFFRNITAARVGYLTVQDREGSELDRAWLEQRWQARGTGDLVRHIELDAPLVAHVNGRERLAYVLKP
jgi:CheY-like chemotaxis protein